MTVDKDGVLWYDERTEQCSADGPVSALAERGFSYKAESPLCIEVPLEGFTEATLDNLERLIAAKATLIKKAIGSETLPIERTEATLRFPWLSADASLMRFKHALCS